MLEEKTTGENAGTGTGVSGVQHQWPECCDASMKGSCRPMMEIMMKKFSRAAEATGQDRSGSSALEIPSCCGPMVERMFRSKAKPAPNDGKTPHEEEDAP